MNKYGVDNFSIKVLEENIPVELLNEKEIEWIKKEKTFVDDGEGGYNLTRGGCQNCVISKETREKHRQNALSGKTGHTHLPRDLVYTPEVREKMSESQKGRKPSLDSIRRGAEKRRGRKTSEATKQKLREINIGRHLTKEQCKKISDHQKERLKDKRNHNFYGKTGKDSSYHIEVLQYDKNWNFIQEFGSKQEALVYLGLKGHTQFNNAIKNKTLYKNYYWIKKDVETIENIETIQEVSRVAS